jgi:hypothetical protein
MGEARLVAGLTRLEQELMNEKRRTTLFIVCAVLVILIICGLIGYFNDPRRGLSVSSATPSPAESLIELNYCYSPSISLCIVSFGEDNANNSLIVVKNSKRSLPAFYLNIRGAGDWQRYECQKVQFSSDIFYCSGAQLQDDILVTIEIHIKRDDRLIASGSLIVSVNATPAPEFTNTPVGVIPTPTQAATVTIKPETQTPSYPNPYPNPTYPNP